MAERRATTAQQTKTKQPQRGETSQAQCTGSNRPQRPEQDHAQEAERQRETSRAAQTAIDAQNKAKELTQAAAGAGDPEERQKLLNEALQKEVEAENFGKTAKYLNSGAFQGLLAGTGLGGGVGLWLGTVTGTLVGGLSGTVTGGVGGGIGLGVGALHGPWFKVGNMMGEGIKKITGSIPGWKATEEQKQALEKMINGVKEQDRPKDQELTQMAGGGKVAAGKGYTGTREDGAGQKSALTNMLPSVPGFGSKKQDSGGKPESKPTDLVNENVANQGAAKRDDRFGKFAGEAVTTPSTKSDKPTAKRGKEQSAKTASSEPKPAAPAKVGKTGQIQNQGVPTPSGDSVSASARKKSDGGPAQRKKGPRKLEIRSKQTAPKTSRPAAVAQRKGGNG